jgi:hypothetical protein
MPSATSPAAGPDIPMQCGCVTAPQMGRAIALAASPGQQREQARGRGRRVVEDREVRVEGLRLGDESGNGAPRAGWEMGRREAGGA